MELIKVYFSIVILVVYVTVEETYADEYADCLSSLNNLFNFQGIKNAYNCYTFAYYNLDFDTSKDSYGVHFYGYLYGQILDKNSLPTPRTFCLNQFSQELDECTGYMDISGFSQGDGMTALYFAFTTKNKYKFKKNTNNYPFKYFEHLYHESISRLSGSAMDLDRWCFHHVHTVNSENKIERRTDIIDRRTECKGSLSELFGPTVDLNNVLDSFTKAFNDLSPRDLIDDYRKRYFGYLWSKIKKKRSLPSPTKFCAEFDQDALECLEKLRGAGFTHSLGDGSLLIAYRSNDKSFFKQNPNNYPGLYYNRIFNDSINKISEDTLDPQSWCASNGFKKNTALKIDGPEVAIEIGEGSRQ